MGVLQPSEENGKDTKKYELKIEIGKKNKGKVKHKVKNSLSFFLRLKKLICEPIIIYISQADIHIYSHYRTITFLLLWIFYKWKSL